MTFDYMLVIESLISTCLSALLGIDRTFSKDPGGFTTHCLIALASLSYSKIPGTHGHIVMASSAISAATVFKSDSFVRGTNNALAIWVAASVGLNIGAGNIQAAVSTTLTTAAVQFCSRIMYKSVKRTDDSKTPNVVSTDQAEFAVVTNGQI